VDGICTHAYEVDFQAPNIDSVLGRSPSNVSVESKHNDLAYNYSILLLSSKEFLALSSNFSVSNSQSKSLFPSEMNPTIEKREFTPFF